MSLFLSRPIRDRFSLVEVLLEKTINNYMRATDITGPLLPLFKTQYEVSLIFAKSTSLKKKIRRHLDQK